MIEVEALDAWRRRNRRLDHLFSVAACRKALGGHEDGRIDRALDVLERYADGLATGPGLIEAARLASSAIPLDRDRPEERADVVQDWEWYLIPTQTGRGAPYGPGPGVEAVLMAFAWALQDEVTPAFLVEYLGNPGSFCNSPLNAVNRAAQVLAEPWYPSRRYFELAMTCPHSEETIVELIAPVMRGLRADIFGPARPLDPAWLAEDVVDIARMMDRSARFDAMPILGDALMELGCDDPAILLHCRGPGPHVRGCWVVDSILGSDHLSCPSGP